MNLTTGAISTYTEGHYSFINLPKGTFGILFADRNYEVPGLGKISAALELTPYTAALSNVGDNDRIDSDGLPCYAQENDTEYGAGDLKYSFIPNILMPDESALSTRVYVSSANDAGFFDRDKASGTASLTGKKTVKGANPSAFEFGIYQDEAFAQLWLEARYRPMWQQVIRQEWKPMDLHSCIYHEGSERIVLVPEKRHMPV